MKYCFILVVKVNTYFHYLKFNNMLAKHYL